MKRDEVLFYREGLTTTVSVHSILGSDYIYFKSNGKIDGSYGDALSQLMTSYIAMMLHPKAETRADDRVGQRHVGEGAGDVSDIFKEIEVIEIEPAMIEASKFFDRQSVQIDKFPAGVSFPSDDSKGRVWYNASEEAALLQRRHDRCRARPS